MSHNVAVRLNEPRLHVWTRRPRAVRTVLGTHLVASTLGQLLSRIAKKQLLYTIAPESDHTCRQESGSKSGYQPRISVSKRVFDSIRSFLLQNRPCGH